jgi:hypothetical protein
MKRKHIPGCYCCNNDEPPANCYVLNCCSEDEVFPEISTPNTNWTPVSQSVSEDCCCVTQVFEHDPDPVFECCESPGLYSYLHEAVRSDYGYEVSQELINFATQCGGAPLCMDDLGVDCCLPQPTKIADWTFEFEHNLEYWFSVKFYYTIMEVTYGKQLVQCDTDEEEVCRYYLKVNLRGRIDSKIVAKHTVRFARDLTYLHPCFEYTGEADVGKCVENDNGILIPQEANICNDPRAFIKNKHCNFEKSCVTCEDAYTCDVDCAQTANDDVTPTECWGKSIPFCLEYIKWFDEQPDTGRVTFDDTDILDEDHPCPRPLCSINCPDAFGGTFTGTITVSSGVPNAPWWYTNPPTVENTTATLVLNLSRCQANWRCGNNGPYLAGSISTCCDGDGIVSTISCPPQDCQGIEIEFLSQKLVSCVEPADDPLSCRLSGHYLFASPVCGLTAGIFSSCNVVASLDPIVAQICGVGINQGYFPPCIRLKCGTTEPCGDSDCCYSFTCECFCRCVPKFTLDGAFATNTYDFSASGNWVEKECVFTIGLTSIDLTF